VSSDTPIWRSMLFVPAHIQKFVERAHTRGADAYILDLEDSVPVREKASARQQLEVSVPLVRQGGAAALLRINAQPEQWEADLSAACLAGVSAIVLPKVNAPVDVASVATRLDALEQTRGLVAGSVRVIAQIEHVTALTRLDEIARSAPRLLGMILGSEDFSASAGMDPIPQTLFLPNQLIVFACLRAGILPFGFPASIADYTELDAFRSHIRLARRMGLVGAFCIHPSQVEILNQEFLPSSADIEAARGVIAAFDAGTRAGKGATSYRGQMIDPPVVARAYEVLRRAEGHRQRPLSSVGDLPDEMT
jgi:citrate lyase subunit beta / citryl-CoA lyase